MLQALPWMLQPVLVRRWVDAAVVLSPPGLLHPDAAEALRIAARLLDSPLPPALAACFEECEPEPALFRPAVATTGLNRGDRPAMRAPATAFIIFTAALGSPPGAWAADSPAALYRQALAATCANCHGTQGQPIAQPAVPGLAGTPVNYFASRCRPSRPASARRP